MVNVEALHRAFREYARGLLEPYEVGNALYWLTDLVPTVIDVDGAGVWLGTEGATLRMVTATDAQVTRVENQQLEIGQGPCLEAFRTGEQVTSEDLTQDGRWPGFSEAAARVGFRSVAGLPMPVDHTPIGALNLYRRQPSRWTPEELEAAQLLADMATGYVINVRTLHESRSLSDQLTHALDSRVIIEQAKGVLAGRKGIDVDAAFEELRNHARRSRRPLHEVCRQVVGGELDL